MPSLEPNLTKESLENKIGLYWLHRIGIASLVLGFVFLILYSIQYFSPILKLAIGWIASVTLIVTGERMASQKKQAWFGQGLVGGGWSLAYFTMYAACYIPGVQVIDSLPLATLLLTAVAGGSLFSALRANSELMAILSVALAGLSILIGGYQGLVGDIPFVIIACSGAFLGNRKNWNTLLAFAIGISYSGHLYSTLITLDDAGRTLAIGYLSVLWLALAAGIGFSSNTSVNTRRFRIVVACINTAVFSFCLHLLTSQLSAQVEELLFAAAGAVYLGIGKWLRKRQIDELSAAHMLMGLVLVNGAKAMRYSGVTAVTLDVMQIALLSAVGKRFAVPAFRWFAVILSVILFPCWFFGAVDHHSMIILGIHAFDYFKIGLVATFVLGAICYEYRSTHGIPQAKSWFFYNICANLMFALVICQLVNPCWQASLAALQAVANHFVYVRKKHELPGIIGALALLWALSMVLACVTTWTVAPVILMIATLVAAYFEMRKHKGIDYEPSVVLNRAYGLSACFILALLIWQKSSAAYVSLDLGVEAIILLIGGFTLRDRLLRTYGLAILALVACKLLFVDAASYNTIERVTSFIAAGAVFLLSSFAYTKFTIPSAEEADSQTVSPSVEDLSAEPLTSA